MLAIYTIKPKDNRYKAIQIREKNIDELLKLFGTIGDKYTDINTFKLKVRRDSLIMDWGSLPPLVFLLKHTKVTI